MGIKHLNLSSFIQVSTIKDEKSAEKFHYIKTVSGKLWRNQLPCINILAGDDHCDPEILAETDTPLLKAASFDIFCLVAPQP